MGAVLTVKNLGPIEECVLEVTNFTVLTGKQASGKSTIAKCVYFFRSIKEDIADEIIKRQTSNMKKLKKDDLYYILSNKFVQIFGDFSGRNINVFVGYKYSQETTIEYNIIKTGSLWAHMFTFSDDINAFVNRDQVYQDRTALMSALNELFHDEYQAVFIPAGRSSISLLSSQLSYFYATMDDSQKRTIDYCTQKYIELILKLRPILANELDQYYASFDAFRESSEYKNLIAFRRLMDEVLNGKYAVVNNEERIYLDDIDDPVKRYVKLNYSSSGQQETVWIFNILMYLLANRTKAFIILEEPEAHLYPDSQRLIAEMLALASNMSCQMLVTTHSPYILGAVNNLIYADYLSKHTKRQSEIDNVISSMCRIHDHSAYYVDMGKIQSCIDDEPEKLIINEVIDGASEKINSDYDKLFDISLKDGDDSAV